MDEKGGSVDLAAWAAYAGLDEPDGIGMAISGDLPADAPLDAANGVLALPPESLKADAAALAIYAARDEIDILSDLSSASSLIVRGLRDILNEA